MLRHAYAFDAIIDIRRHDADYFDAAAAMPHCHDADAAMLMICILLMPLMPEARARALFTYDADAKMLLRHALMMMLIAYAIRLCAPC